MSNSDNRLQVVLTRLNDWDDNFTRAEYIELLEGLIQEFNDKARTGEPSVPDSIYDVCMDLLKTVNPDSPLLRTLWTEDDPSVSLDEGVDDFQVRYPMLSIQTIKNYFDKELLDFKSRLPMFTVDVCCTIKLNGHGIRAVWKDGYLVKATSRGRSTAGRDITNQLKIILGEYNEGLSGLGLVEMRGEVLLPFSRLEEARKYNPSIKSAFSGVASMIRASATEEETRLLDILFYDILTDGIDFSALSEKIGFIQNCGFKVPITFIDTIQRDNLEDVIKNILVNMEELTDSYDYYSDGVIVAIDDLELFMNFGEEETYRNGNLAIKMGKWKQDSYMGVVKEIRWEEGKTKKTPVAVLEEGVMTATGNTVTNIPLYAPCYILILEAYIGNVIHFRYGGEAGVIPVMPDGTLVTDTEMKIDVLDY